MEYKQPELINPIDWNDDCETMLCYGPYPFIIIMPGVKKGTRSYHFKPWKVIKPVICRFISGCVQKPMIKHKHGRFGEAIVLWFESETLEKPFDKELYSRYVATANTSQFIWGFYNSDTDTISRIDFSGVTKNE